MSKAKKRYETERTRELSLKDLSQYESGTLNKVEEFALAVTHVKYTDDPRPTFSYTIGLHNTLKGPELITCGLPVNTAHSALNYAAELIADG